MHGDVGEDAGHQRDHQGDQRRADHEVHGKQQDQRHERRDQKAAADPHRRADERDSEGAGGDAQRLEIELVAGEGDAHPVPGDGQGFGRVPRRRRTGSGVDLRPAHPLRRSFGLARRARRRPGPGLVQDPRRDQNHEAAENGPVEGHVAKVGLREPRTGDGAERRADSERQGERQDDAFLALIDGDGENAADELEDLIGGLDHVGVADPENRDMADARENAPAPAAHGHDESRDHRPSEREIRIERQVLHTPGPRILTAGKLAPFASRLQNG